MICYQSHHFFQSLIDWSLRICHSLYTQTAKQIVKLSPSYLVVNPHNILQKWKIERENWQRWKCNNEIKSENAGNEIWMKHKWNHGRNLCLWKGRRSRDSECAARGIWGPGEGELININEESGCDEKNEVVPRKWHYQKTSHWKNSEKYFTTLKAQWMKWWKVMQT